MTNNSPLPSASTNLNWRASADPRKEFCQFEHNGRRYIAHRAAGTTTVTGLAKRERTNRSGTQYVPLAMKGKAAREVLSRVFSSTSGGNS